ncbi:DNA repair protein complementing XP-C cells homolog [Lepeophtheirus salmonis]|uniref:DNA repair protein complementing XP-C cells homolog n=1 Tax=Lepeophtheirus salmonis TaxID=72036 RepID=UPI001AE16BC9|nr:DNA repair protein complementing XP-C cells homolog [Lepeophtheirus salmonis]
MPKKPSKRKSGSAETLISPKKPKNPDEETNFDDLLSQIATQSQNQSLWNKKETILGDEEKDETNEEFSVEPGLISDSSEDDDYEEEELIQNPTSSPTKDGNKVIEIHIKSESKPTLKDKRSKKRMQAIQREAKHVKNLIHRVRFLSSVAHLLYVGHNLGNSDTFRALSLSLFPQAHFKTTPTPTSISSFIKWYYSASSVFPGCDLNMPLEDRLLSAFPKLEFSSQLDRILGFYLLSLSAGWNVRLLYAPPEDNNDSDNRHWIEIWTSDPSWTIVDPFSGRSGKISKEIEKRLSPFWYVIALSKESTLKDLTPKYVQNYVTSVSKKRKPHEEWVQSTLRPFLSNGVSKEDDELYKLMNEAPIPSSLSALKGHPLYITPKHLGKLEVIYPLCVKPVGYIKRIEPVFERKHVHKLRSKISWEKDGMAIKEGEVPRICDKDKAFWGSWQIKKFVPPEAKNGKVPKNEFGNVELYKPWMLPKGTVHIPISGIIRLAKKLDIDFAPAVIGWDYHIGGSHPVIDGIIVCTEVQDLIMDAWNNDEDVKSTQYYEKRVLRILSNWRKLTKGLILRERFKLKYKV